jgi:serpin B
MMTGDSFRLANAIWIDNGFRGRISDSFLDRDRAYFGASVGTLRFASSAAPKIIGDWIRKNTNDRIDPKIKEFDPDTVMLLANTIYFKSDWKDQFDANDTRDDVFHAPSGDKTLKFMHGMRGGYFEDETLQGIRLPYEDGKTSLLILLPKKDLSGMASSLSAEKLAAFLRQGRESKESAQLSLPRVHFSYDATLNDALKAMGLAEAFGGQADFGGMLRPGGVGLFISKVQHMTALAVDEKGTEAAAATTVAMVASAPVVEHEMNVDHPFFAAIVNDESGAALFAGVIADPSAGE